jgi:hypothetical protein
MRRGMKKTKTKRLALSRTTVQVLTERALAGAAGGVINTGTQADNCTHPGTETRPPNCGSHNTFCNC